MENTRKKLQELNHILRGMGKAAVAFSGGVDSSFLLKAAKDVLGDGVIAVTASFRSFPARDLADAKAIAEGLGARHIIFELDDLAIEGFAENPPDRCYLCKKEILRHIAEIACNEGFAHIIEGSNADDGGDYRPGTRAVMEAGVQSPLRDAGLTKTEIRSLSKEMGLFTWEKPSCACLASRFVYGERITAEKLRMVDQAEEYLRSIGFSQVRVRVHGGLARIEVSPEEMPRFAKADIMEDAARTLQSLGFDYVALDLLGYRVGSMNETLPKPVV